MRDYKLKLRNLHVSHTLDVFIITDKTNLVGEEVKGVGVMKDEELKFEEIKASHTLGLFIMNR